jgi:hypothetical protein
VGYAVSYPHPLYTLGGNFLPFAYPWVQISYHTLTLMGKNPLGKRVMDTHCHQEFTLFIRRYNFGVLRWVVLMFFPIFKLLLVGIVVLIVRRDRYKL